MVVSLTTQSSNPIVKSLTSHNFATPRTRQKNEIVERKNMILQETVRTIYVAWELYKHLRTFSTLFNIQNSIDKPNIKKGHHMNCGWRENTIHLPFMFLDVNVTFLTQNIRNCRAESITTIGRLTSCIKGIKSFVSFSS